MIKDILKIIVLTSVFSIFIFFINYAFFWQSKEVLEKQLIESKYIDPSLWINLDTSYNDGILQKYTDQYLLDRQENIDKIRQDIKNKVIEEENKKIKQKVKTLEIKQEKERGEDKIKFIYLPDNIRNSILYISNNIYKALKTNTFDSKINSLVVEFYETRYDTRWKMKNWIIKLFDPLKMWEIESFSVFIHELWHIIDIYFLENISWNDISNIFYEISWDSTTIMKAWQNQNDFVSGYSMTNKYEDFAESFNFFVLHNNDFLQKTKSSDLLVQKYIFFNNHIFSNNKFVSSDFSIKQNSSYLWDTTKLDINIKNFLQYIEK